MSSTRSDEKGVRSRTHVLAPSLRARGPGAQGGFGLVETLVAVLMTSLVVLALAAGLLTLVRVTSANSDEQQLQLAVGNYAEGLKALPYLPCGTDAAHEAAYTASPQRWEPPIDVTLEVVEVEYWHRVTGAPATPGPGDFRPSCATPDQGAQRLTLQAALPDRAVTTQVVVGTR